MRAGMSKSKVAKAPELETRALAVNAQTYERCHKSNPTLHRVLNLPTPNTTPHHPGWKNQESNLITLSKLRQNIISIYGERFKFLHD